MYSISAISPFAESPVSVWQVKADLRIQHSDDDSLLRDYIAAATAYCAFPDGVTGKVLSTQDFVFKTRGADKDGYVYLPATPAQSITTVTYYDSDNASQSLDLADYEFFGNEDTAFIKGVWPALYDRFDAVTVTYKAGFVNPPENVSRAIRLIAAHWYEHRTEVVLGATPSTLPMAAQSLLSISRKGWAS